MTNNERNARLDAAACRRETKRNGGSYPEALRQTARYDREAAARYRNLDGADREASNLEEQAAILDQMADRARS